MFEHIINEELSLKLLKMTDAESIYNLIDSGRDYLREWLPWVDYYVSIESSKQFIDSALKQYANNEGFQAGIWFKGKLVGIIGLYGLSYVNRSTSIGYWLGEKYQGNGIMTNACKAVINYIFNELNLNRIEIRTATENYKSAAIPKRLGFKQEGVVRQAEWLYDHYVDHTINAMLKEEWSETGK